MLSRRTDSLIAGATDLTCGVAEARARWPAAWETIAPERAIPTPDAAEERQRDVVVISCFNEAATIAARIGDLLEDRRLVDPLVVVIDGGSTDGSAAIVSWIAARDPRVQLALD